MAEKKYDLALVKTVNDRIKKHHPWYKERLQTKYIKSLKPGETVYKNLDGKCWRFVKPGIDDFRDGVPPYTLNNFVIMPRDKGVGPVFCHEKNVDKPSSNQKHRFTKEQLAFSKLSPGHLLKKEGIEEVELGLTQHPLALYPHLQECVPPEIFEDIVDLIDPQMNIRSDSRSTPDDFERLSPQPDHVTDDYFNKENVNNKDIKNQFYWLPKRENFLPTISKKKVLERKERSKEQEKHIQTITEEFCDWVANIGGNTNNIEEATISSLFASGYETKPALTVPIHVVDIANIPSELRAAALSDPGAESEPDPDRLKQSLIYSTINKPDTRRIKYGAWYLHPHTWKKQQYGEPLRDPKEIALEKKRSENRKTERLNQELAEVHGTTAFMSFIDQKNSRRPEFLDEIAAIQRMNAEDEKRRLDEERAAKLKRFPNTGTSKIRSS